MGNLNWAKVLIINYLVKPPTKGTNLSSSPNLPRPKNSWNLFLKAKEIINNPFFKGLQNQVFSLIAFPKLPKNGRIEGIFPFGKLEWELFGSNKKCFKNWITILKKGPISLIKSLLYDLDKFCFVILLQI